MLMLYLSPNGRGSGSALGKNPFDRWFQLTVSGQWKEGCPKPKPFKIRRVRIMARQRRSAVGDADRHLGRFAQKGEENRNVVVAHF